MADKSGFLGLGVDNSLGWQERLARFPWSLLILLVLTAAIGFVVLYSAVGGDEGGRLILRQIGRFGGGLLLMSAVALLGERKIYLRYAYLFYGISLALLLSVFLAGSIGMGARRWLEFGAIRLQPSELMKVALILALSRYFHDRAVTPGYGWRELWVPLLMILAPLALIIKQPDLGTGVILAAVGMVVVVVAGLSWKILLGSAVVLGASLPLAWSGLHDYQRNRITTLFFPDRDPLGAGYHIIQSKIAVGSGGWTGKGFMAGSQSHLDFLPERHTDFIFSVLAEEWGFLGGMVLLFMYLLVTARCMIIAGMAHERFGLLTVAGLTSLFAFQVIINIGMVIGLLPVVGLPLPLISHGGSSMVTIMLAMGFMAHVHIHSKQHGRSV